MTDNDITAILQADQRNRIAKRLPPIEGDYTMHTIRLIADAERARCARIAREMNAPAVAGAIEGMK